MAETTTAVQPVATQGGPPPAPLQLKMFAVGDPNVGQALVQAVALVDDQGRALAPMSETTGKEIVGLLRSLIRAVVDSGNGQGLYPPDGGQGLDQ